MKTIESSKLRGVILDMDGVLWRGEQELGSLKQIFARLAKNGWKVTLATNNSTRSAHQYVEKLAGFGVHLEPWQIINSSEATAQFLHRKYPEGGAVFMIGEEGLREALTRYGFHISDQNPVAVVAGMDRQVTYARLSTATLLIRAGAPFIGTNPDRSFPTPQGLTPGAGSILAALEAATDVQPYIIGKPSPEMYQVAMERMGTTPTDTLVIGDRLDTDIAGAQHLGCWVALVLSGVTNREQALAWNPAPHWIKENLTVLLDDLQ